MTVAVHLTHKRPSTGSGGSQGSASHPPEMKPGAQRMTDQWPVGDFRPFRLSGESGSHGNTLGWFKMMKHLQDPSSFSKLGG